MGQEAGITRTEADRFTLTINSLRHPSNMMAHDSKEKKKRREHLVLLCLFFFIKEISDFYGSACFK